MIFFGDIPIFDASNPSKTRHGGLVDPRLHLWWRKMQIIQILGAYYSIL